MTHRLGTSGLSTILNQSRETGHYYLLPDFRGNAFNFSLFSIMLGIHLSYIDFIMLRNVPPIPSLFRNFILNLC